ncbi:hypothetical protein ACT3SZ_05795 [Corynebacterium sp. AOP40-9SA-29]|uniref:hypothetical protein n=1 Tax=Corynebacterium sp. AOP40-9SA-29 TaxID=3457677 RepID=UPI004034F0EA
MGDTIIEIMLESATKKVALERLESLGIEDAIKATLLKFVAHFGGSQTTQEIIGSITVDPNTGKVEAADYYQLMISLSEKLEFPQPDFDQFLVDMAESVALQQIPLMRSQETDVDKYLSVCENLVSSYFPEEELLRLIDSVE